MEEQQSIVLTGAAGRPMPADVHWSSESEKAPVVIYVHGFKGFKDWGANHLMAQKMVQQGFVFVKFNFSHNGTTPGQPADFADLEAFGNNNFSKELFDLGVVIDWVCSETFRAAHNAGTDVYLLGHSRGGGIALLKAAEDTRVKKVVTLAAVSEFGKFWSAEQMEQMNRTGVLHIFNQRTGQQMPIYRQMYDDYEANRERLHIPTRVTQMQQPLLVIHGTADATVPFRAAQNIKQWKPDAELMLLEDADHSFGARHPWTEGVLPLHLDEALQRVCDFLK